MGFREGPRGRGLKDRPMGFNDLGLKDPGPRGMGLKDPPMGPLGVRM